MYTDSEYMQEIRKEFEKRMLHRISEINSDMTYEEMYTNREAADLDKVGHIENGKTVFDVIHTVETIEPPSLKYIAPITDARVVIHEAQVCIDSKMSIEAISALTCSVSPEMSKNGGNVIPNSREKGLHRDIFHCFSRFISTHFTRRVAVFGDPGGTIAVRTQYKFDYYPVGKIWSVREIGFCMIGKEHKMKNYGEFREYNYDIIICLSVRSKIALDILRKLERDRDKNVISFSVLETNPEIINCFRAKVCVNRQFDDLGTIIKEKFRQYYCSYYMGKRFDFYSQNSVYKFLDSNFFKSDNILESSAQWTFSNDWYADLQFRQYSSMIPCNCPMPFSKYYFSEKLDGVTFYFSNIGKGHLLDKKRNKIEVGICVDFPSGFYLVEFCNAQYTITQPLFSVGCSRYLDYFNLVKGLTSLKTSKDFKFLIKKWNPVRLLAKNDHYIFSLGVKMRDYVTFSEGVVIVDAYKYVGMVNVSYGKLDTYFFKRMSRKTYEDYVNYDGSIPGYRGNLDHYRDPGNVFKGKGIYEIHVHSKTLLQNRLDKTTGDTNWYKQKLEDMKLPIKCYPVVKNDYQVSYINGVYKIYNTGVVLSPPDEFDSMESSIDININQLPRKMVYPGMLISISKNNNKFQYYVTKERAVYHSALEVDSQIPDELFLKFRKVLNVGDRSKPRIL